MNKRKKKNYLLIGIAAALVLTTGSYASTYRVNETAIAIGLPDGDLATANITTGQPNWTTVLTPVTDTLVLRPDAPGDQTNISGQTPGSGAHWDKVDEETSDGDSTTINTGSFGFEEDLFNVPDYNTQLASGPINSVTVYINARNSSNPTRTNAYLHIQTNGGQYDSPEITTTTGYATYSYEWTNNPQTGSAWTWDEVDTLQIGAGLRRGTFPGSTVYVTQVWAEVSFDAPLLTDITPTGNLYTVTPDAAYTGDVTVNVYLLNSEDLTKAFTEFNMNLYLEGSVEAGQSPDYQVLNTDTGLVSFWIDDGGSGNQTLSVAGGNYTLTSREPTEWESGYSVTPELFVEVTQR